MCLVQQKTLQALQGSAINKNVQCTLPPRPIYQNLLSDFQGSGLETIRDVTCQLHVKRVGDGSGKLSVKSRRGKVRGGGIYSGKRKRKM